MQVWTQHHHLETDFWNSALEETVLCIRETLETFQDCRIGLAGGSTPQTLYQKLAQEKLPWERIIFILLDERCVPSDHSESNLRMIRKSLFNHLPCQPKAALSFDTALKASSAAKEMDRRLSELQRESRPLFDLLLLGAGKDGHIASLFEGTEALNSKHLAETALAKGYPTPERLTLTLKAILDARAGILLLKGKEKSDLMTQLDQLKNKDIQHLPFTALDALAHRVPLKIHGFL